MHGSTAQAGFWTWKTGFSLALYLLLWLVSSFLALNYYHGYNTGPAHGGGCGHNLHCAARAVLDDIDAGKAEQAWNAIRAPDPGRHDAPGHAQAVPAHGDPASLDSLQESVRALDTDIALLRSSVEERMHPAQTLEASLLKVLVVVAISWLWFHTFLLSNELKQAFARWRRFRTPFEAMRYRQRQDELRDELKNKLHGAWPPGRAPATAPVRQRWRERPLFRPVPSLAKALLVIVSLLPALCFAVAMHAAYEPAVFVMALAAIFVAAEHYAGLTETEHELKARTDDLKQTMGIVLDADGLNEWRKEVYDLYGKARNRVDAVIRIFDIDAEWWKCAGSGDPWQEYRERCALSSGDDTLLSVLSRSQARVSFVSDQPLDTLAQLAIAPPAERKEFFRALLGLAWNLVVFDMAGQARLAQGEGARPGGLRIRISRAPSWMHVVDETVFQVIERGKEGNATVRQLTHSITDAKDKRALSGWARDSVRRFAQRGGRAEEYVFSALRLAALGVKCNEDQALPLTNLLVELGMRDYLNEPKPDFLLAPADDVDQRMNRSVLLSEPTAQRLCTAVFEELLTRRLRRGTGFVAAWTDPKCLKLKYLLGEVL